MANRQTFLDGIFALHDVDIGAADRGRRYSEQCVKRAYLGDGLFVKRDSAGFRKNRYFHLLSHGV